MSSLIFLSTLKAYRSVGSEAHIVSSSAATGCNCAILLKATTVDTYTCKVHQRQLSWLKYFFISKELIKVLR